MVAQRTLLTFGLKLFFRSDKYICSHRCSTQKNSSFHTFTTYPELPSNIITLLLLQFIL